MLFSLVTRFPTSAMIPLVIPKKFSSALSYSRYLFSLRAVSIVTMPSSLMSIWLRLSFCKLTLRLRILAISRHPPFLRLFYDRSRRRRFELTSIVPAINFNKSLPIFTPISLSVRSRGF